MAVSVKSNIFYNILLTCSSYIVSLLVFPYISRILGVDNIGAVGFVNKAIDIFMLFTTLGVSVVGVREIALHKDDEKDLDKVFSGLVTALLICTVVVTIIYLFSIYSVQKFRNYELLFLVGTARLLTSFFYIEWFFQGVEKFKYIAIRGVVVRVIYVLSVFFFVHDSSDVNIYYYLTTLSVIANGLINWISAKKIVHFSFAFKQARSYFKPLFSFGLYTILNATFSTCNYLFIGFLCTDREVGYYSTAESLYRLFLSLISACTSVLLPRMSYLVSLNDKDAFDITVNNSFNYLLALCLPLSIFGIFNAEQIIRVIAGPGYEGAIIPLQIMMVLILMNAINQVFIIQVAIPHSLDKYITIGTAIASVISIPLNYYLVKDFGALGSSIVLVFSIIIANALPIYVLLQKKILKFPKDIFVKQIINTIPYFIISIAFVLIHLENPFAHLIWVSGLYTIVFLFINKSLILKIVK